MKKINVMTLFMPNMKIAHPTKAGNQMLDGGTDTTTFSDVFGKQGNLLGKNELATLDDTIQVGELLSEYSAEEMQDILSHIDDNIVVPLPAQAAWRGAVRKEAAHRRMKRLIEESNPADLRVFPGNGG